MSWSDQSNANYSSVSVGNFYDANELAYRFKVLLHQNPYMSDNPGAALTMAQMPMDLVTLSDQSAAMYGLQNTDRLRTQLAGMSPGQQRTVFDNLSPAVQQSLGQAGYAKPERDEEAWYESFAGPLTPALEAIGGGLGGAAKALQLDHALDALIWIGDRPAHLYRTIRLMDEEDQWLALAGGIAAFAFMLNPIGLGAVGLGALGAATTGGTLATAGALGTATLLGATATAAITNSTDWANAFVDSYRGERTFDRQSQRDAEVILGDPRMVNLAREVALVVPEDYNLIDFAKDMAGNRDVSYESQVKFLDEVVKRMAQPNTPEYQTIYQGLSTLMQTETFQKAVTALQNGKISFGRDIADWSGFEPGSTMFNIVSGGVDAAWQLAMDPILLGTKIYNVAAFARRGMPVMDAEASISRFEKIYKNNKSVRRVYEYVAEAVNKGDASIIGRYAPSMREQYMHLLAHRGQLLRSGDLKDGLMTGDQVAEWVTGTYGIKALMEGYGTVRGISNGVLLAKVGPTSQSFKTVASGVRAFTNGLTDVRNEEQLIKIIREGGDPTAGKLLSPLLFPKIADDVAKWELDTLIARFRKTIDDWNALPEQQRISIGQNWVPANNARSSLDYIDPEFSAIRERLEQIAGPNGLGAYTADEVTPELLENFALASENSGWAQMARRAGRTLGAVEIPRLGSPFAAIGDLFTKMSTMAPAGKVISLNDAATFDDVKAFSEMAALTGMPQWMRKNYMNLVLWQPTVGTRMNAMMSLLDNMMTISGMRETAEGAELLDRYLRRIYHSYTAGGLDELVINGTTSKQAVFLGEIADHIVMPNMKELREANQAGFLASLVGLADRPMVEAFQTRVWKPSVLLRFGFIPRAAGEEFLSFMMRGGLGSIGQELHGYSLAKYKTVTGLIARKNAGETLSVAEEELLNVSRMPFGLRKMTRTLDRAAWGHPAIERLEKWNGFYRRLQENGFSAFADVEGAVNRGLTAIGGAPIKVYPSADNVGALARARATMPNGRIRQLNRGMMVDSLVLGNANSWRRMAVGGVNDDIVEAGMRWFDRTGRAIMSELGASTNGPVGNFYDPQRTISVEMRNSATGQIEDQIMEVVPGERIMLTFDDGGDTYYANAVAEHMHRPFDDELGQRVVGEVLTRMIPNTPNVTPQNAAESIVSIGKFLFDPDGKRAVSNTHELIALEFLSGEPSYERLVALADKLSMASRSGVTSTNPVAEAIYAMKETDVTWSRFQANLALSGVDKKLKGRYDLLNPVVGMMNKLSRAEQRQMAAVLSWTSPQRFKMAEEAAANPDVAARMFFIDDDAGSAWSKATPQMRAYLINELNSPYYAQRLGHLQDMPAVSGQVASNFEKSVLHDGFVTTWKPAIRQGVAGQYVSDGSLLQATITQRATPNQAAVLNANRDLVLNFLDSRSNGFDPVLANRELADAMNAVFGRGDNNVLAVDLPRHVLDGNLPVGTRVMGLSEGGRVGAWSFPKDVVLSARPVNAQLEDSIAKFVDRYIEAMRLTWGRGRREALIPRTRILEDGTEESVVWRQLADGTFGAVDKTTPIVAKQQFYDHQMRTIEFGSTKHFDRQVTVSSDELMWDAIGPMIRDVADERFDRMNFVAKTSKRPVGTEVTSQDQRLTRMLHSKVAHIREAGADAPNFIDAVKLRVPTSGTWEKVVRYGFDRVIGPAIDALARRPMAFHFFSQRYIQNKALRGWLMDAQLLQKANDSILRVAQGVTSSNETYTLANAARDVGRFVTEDTGVAAKWGDAQSLAWLRGHSLEEFDSMLRIADARINAAVNDGKMTVAFATDLQTRVETLRTAGHKKISDLFPPEATEGDFFFFIRQRTEPGFLDRLSDNFAHPQSVLAEIQNDPILSALNLTDWDNIIAANRNYQGVLGEAADAAAVAAINDMLPFIDSHEFKSQFAEYGKGFLPFWYAEENFLKRWARTAMLEGPALIRKMQLGYMGLKTSGIIRTDQNGRDWFVYPGSNLLQEAINKIPGLPNTVTGVMFQTPTDMMLPGMNSRFGTPQFGPFVTVPVDFAVTLLPELETQQRALFGDLTTTKNILELVVPSGLVNTIMAVSSSESSSRWNSAMIAAIAHLEATDNWIPDNASAGQIEDALDRARNHARIIVVAQALGGWFTPGPPSAITTGTETPFAGIGLDIQDPGAILNSIYQERVRALGIEKGTIQFLEDFPNATLDDIVNPLAFTVSRNVSVSGAPLPATEIAMQFFDDNSEYMSEFPNAGPWLLPIAESANDTHSQYAYDQQTISGLRRRRTPEEFATALKFKKASGKYFSMRSAYLKLAEDFRTQNSSENLRLLNAAWDVWSNNYKAANPVFASELENSDARQRRKTVIEEMRTIMNDPDRPRPPHGDVISEMMMAFDAYMTMKGELSLNRSAQSVANVLRLKTVYEQVMDNLALKNPAVQSFWTSILRPESELE